MSTTTWTPRTPAADEPACWSWPVPPILTVEERVTMMLAEEAGKPWDEQLGEDSIRLILEGGDPRFYEFHQDRCAICGVHKPVCGSRTESLVDDHCYATGQIRARLCRPCNSREGRSSKNPAPIIVRYRGWHSAAILDCHDMYSGYGWHFGWDSRVCDPWNQATPFRPATPWPAWNPDLITPTPNHHR